MRWQPKLEPKIKIGTTRRVKWFAWYPAYDEQTNTYYWLEFVSRAQRFAQLGFSDVHNDYAYGWETIKLEPYK